MHGYQIWVALPKAKEDMEPQFHHVEAQDLPKWEQDGMQFKLVAGEGYGRKSPVPVHSNLFMVEVIAPNGGSFNADGNLEGEIGVCVVDGQIQACEHLVDKGNMLVSKVERACTIELKPGAHVLLFGGEPFEEERFINWNFVSSSQEKIEMARSAWREKSFPMMDSDDTYIPLPGHKL